MYLGDGRNAFYIFLSIFIFLLWYSTFKHRNHEKLDLEVKLLPRRVNDADFHGCSTDTCIKLDRCLFDLDRIRVYVQPMVKIMYPNEKEMKLQLSNEFNQIRLAILRSKYSVDSPDKACLVVPGIDLLNLKRFKSANEVQRVMESINTLLPPNSNLLLFNFIGLRDPLHLKAIWASASLDQFTLRRKFDVSVPMLRPYSLNYTENQTFVDHQSSKQYWTVVLRFAPDKVNAQIKDVLKSVGSNVCYLFEGSEEDVKVVKDQDGQQRDYIDVLRHSTFTLIHDLVPGFQMIILDAMQCGSIPVIISDDYLPPFHELLDWSRFSILLAKQNLQELPRILNSIPPGSITKMLLSAQRVYWHHLSSPYQVAISTLNLIERRILPIESDDFYADSEWGNDEEFPDKRLWLNVPVRSVASNFTVILALPQQLSSFERSIRRLREAAQPLIHSIFVLWPVEERPSGLQTLNAQLQSELKISIHYLDWDPSMLSTNLAAFMDLILYRPDSSRECLLFMDLRSPNDPNLMKDIIEQSFSAWKENADSILSFDPFHPEVDGKPASTVVENRKQAPFFGGAAFIHPHAAEDIGKSTSEDQFARCSRVSMQNPSCKAEDSKCIEFAMEFCRPIFL